MIGTKTNLHEFGLLFQEDLDDLSFHTPLLDFIEPENKNKLGAEALIKQFELIIDRQVRRSLEGWKSDYQAALIELITTLETYREKLANLDQDGVPASEIRREFELFLRAIREWVDSTSQKIVHVKFWQDLQNQFEQELASVPIQAEIPIPPDFWEPKPDDSLRTQMVKRKKRAKQRVKVSTFFALNQVRKSVGRAPLNPHSTHRTFNVHNFLKYVLEIPVAEFLMTEWLQFLNHAAKQLYALHMKTIEIREDFRFLFDFEVVLSHFSTETLAEPLKHLESHAKLIHSQIQQLDQIEVEARQRARIREMEIYRAMRQQWSCAGTELLPAAEFSEQKVAHVWNQFEASLKRSRRRWKSHFQAEQGEWQAGIELSLLELRTVQIYFNITTNINQKARSHVLPALKSTLETVDVLSRNIAAITADQQTGISDQFLTENRALLTTLQKDKMPLMMDTLIQVQIENVIKGYAKRVRKAVDVLSEEHTIFLNRDLNNPIPNSETSESHLLRDLILEQIYSKFEQAHQLFSVEIQHTIEKMIRTISEVDQVVEVQLEASFTQLERRKNPASLKIARNTIMSELNQISTEVNDLMAQTKQMVALSEKKLRDLTRVFENNLLNLGDMDDDTHVEKYLILAQKSARETLRSYRRRFLHTIRTETPAAFSLVGDTFQQFRLKYFHLREITGLAGDKEDAGEHLSHFLTDTEHHIKALPYVYQRLFRLAPLSDDRFFTAREEELQMLADEFSRWEAGKFTATALVGERGCGITTLLNFAEQQIYKGYPISKMNFLDGDAVFTNEALFNFLKASFTVADLQGDPKNLDDLEEKVMAMETPKIFILENLQHLFLRTVYGFDALERFMLFISRTYTKIHWVLTCSLYSWEYFAKVLNIDEYVQRKITFQALSQQEIEEIILRRHRASGYQLLFEATPEIAQSRRYKRLKSDQERQKLLQHLFFEQLTELAAGNIAVAMLFWLRSYRLFSEDKLILPASINFDPSFLYMLPAEELFALAALLQHDTMSTQDLSLVFHQDTQQSQLLLNRMANKGYLIKMSNGFGIHPFLYRPVVRVLKSDNIIH